MKKNKKSPPSEEKKNTAVVSLLLRRVLLFSFCLSGMAALIYEVAWTRMLTLILGSTTYAVSTMLSTFMAGLALGGFLGGAAADRSKNALSLFALLQFLIGVSGFLTLLLFNALPSLYYALYKGFHLSLPLYMMFQFLLCALFMLVPTTFMGATFPLLSKVLTQTWENVGKHIGHLYSINNVGAILGSVSAGFLLIPLLGIKGTMFIAAALNLFSGTLILLFSKNAAARLKLVSCVSFVMLLPVLFSNTGSATSSIFNFFHAGRYKSYNEFQNEVKQYQVVFDKEDVHGLVRVFYDPIFQTYYLQNGGKVEGSTGDDVATQVLLAALPSATKPDAKNFLGIGLGTGMTAYEAARRIKDVEWVEINASVVESARKIFYPELLQKINLIMDDGRHYLLVTEKKYDIISSEPSYPTEAATANLFTKEFYALASTKLNPGGVFCQWVPYYALNNDDVDVLLHTFASVFPYTFFWEVPETKDFLFVGSTEKINADAEEILKRLKSEKNAFIPKLLYSQEDMVRILQDMKKRGLRLNTDDKPYLEFSVVKNLIRGSDNLK